MDMVLKNVDHNFSLGDNDRLQRKHQETTIFAQLIVHNFWLKLK